MTTWLDSLHVFGVVPLDIPTSLCDFNSTIGSNTNYS